jgi:enoyl-CoA hydratase/carnithine racemase
MAGSTSDSAYLLEGGGADGIAIMRLCRGPANAIDLGYARALTAAFDTLAERADDIACMLLGSAIPGFFCAGRDLKEMPPRGEKARMERRRVMTALYQSLYALPFATIAVIEGHALGAGAVLTSMCDIRVGTAAASIGLPEVKAGSVGGARHMMRLVPQGTARMMALTGRSLDGAAAERAGFLTVLAADEAAWTEARSLAAAIAASDRKTASAVKRAMNRAEAEALWVGFETELIEGGKLAASRSPD